MTLASIRQMYVFDGLSSPVIAKHAGVSKRTVLNALRAMGVEPRTKTSTRICKSPGCGKETFKLNAHNGRQRCLSGTLCREHALENWRRKNRARKRPA